MHWGRYYNAIAANQDQFNKFNMDRITYNRQEITFVAFCPFQFQCFQTYAATETQP